MSSVGLLFHICLDTWKAVPKLGGGSGMAVSAMQGTAAEMGEGTRYLCACAEAHIHN